MKLSLNWIKKYVPLPDDMDMAQLAYDLTMSTVEVEGMEKLADQFENICIGVINEIQPHPNADKLKVLNAVMEKIEKDFGRGSIMRMSSEQVTDIPVIPSGSITLDVALGVGGYPKGRIVEIYGPESSGKTTIALHAIAEVQKTGGRAAFIDAEHALDPAYAKNIGVDIDNLYISQPDNGEQALEITETLVRSGAVDIIIVDSVAALVPKAEIDGDMGDSHIGLQARLMSQALRKLAGAINKTNAVIIFINH